MDYKEGARVYLANGEEIGKLSRVVFDPRTMQVTDIVIKRGLINPEERIAAATLIESGGDDEIHLVEIPHGWDELTPFEETDYRLMEPNDQLDSSLDSGITTPAVYSYPPTVPITGGMYTPGGTIPNAPRESPDQAMNYTKQTIRNLPEEAVTFDVGARVVSHDGAELGKVEQFFTNPENGQMTHFLISRGLLLKERKLIPADWTEVVSDGEVLLGVNARFVEQLPDYKEQ